MGWYTVKNQSSLKSVNCLVLFLSVTVNESQMEIPAERGQDFDV